MPTASSEFRPVCAAAAAGFGTAGRALHLAISRRFQFGGLQTGETGHKSEKAGGGQVLGSLIHQVTAPPLQEQVRVPPDLQPRVSSPDSLKEQNEAC